MFMLPVTSAYATYIFPAPGPALGQEMSLFAAALEAQDDIPSRSTESEDDCKPSDRCQDDEAAGHNSTATVGNDDTAAGHNSTTTIGDTVHVYRFMAWLDGEPDLLAMEDRFFLRGDVADVEDVVDHEEENLSFQSGKSNSTEHFNFPPCLLLGIQLTFTAQLQSKFTTTKHQSSKTSRWKMDATLHDAQEE
jgi:hypothetical protein